MERRRVAVLGGGVGGMVAAWELTATPELRDRFDVTVYQLGWRVGGKGSSGRNLAEGGRIEEHGLHVWFGFYENAFRVMRAVYEELARPANMPLATLDEAFLGFDEVVFYEHGEEGWRAYPFQWPSNDERPGDGTRLPDFWEIAAAAFGISRRIWHDLFRGRSAAPPSSAGDATVPHGFDGVGIYLRRRLSRRRARHVERLLRLAHAVAVGRARGGYLPKRARALLERLVARVVTHIRDWLWSEVLDDGMEPNEALRLYFTCFDTLATITAGIVRDGVIERGFDSISDEELSVWLKRHGATPLTLGETPAHRASILRSIYDVAFAYPQGDPSSADVAAGTAIKDLFRLMFTYKGHISYKMRAGMGETVFAPLYEVLRRRGVHFAFFHGVTNLGVADTKAIIETIEVVPQVGLGVDEYDPLVTVEGLPCWPTEPLWDQLPQGEALRAGQSDFEQVVNPLDNAAITLRRGVDFDDVVLGIPAPAVPEICQELIARDARFGRAIEKSKTVATQAFQLWLSQPSTVLGWGHSVDSIARGYMPLDVYCEMSHLLPRESWAPTDGVRSVAYFCGVLEERGGETLEEAHARVKANALAFLERGVSTIWPDAVSDGPVSDFRWELLADRKGREGHARLDGQYWRANTKGSDRYILTPAGSVKHRLPSADSGFENLVLAGDWTRNGIDGGCVEGAAISGIQAVRGLTGSSAPILGEDSAWLRLR